MTGCMLVWVMTFLIEIKANQSKILQGYRESKCSATIIFQHILLMLLHYYALLHDDAFILVLLLPTKGELQSHLSSQ
jgi:hypothetical protein